MTAFLLPVMLVPTLPFDMLDLKAAVFTLDDDFDWLDVEGIAAVANWAKNIG